jgi:hypothetical protein
MCYLPGAWLVAVQPVGSGPVAIGSRRAIGSHRDAEGLAAGSRAAREYH